MYMNYIILVNEWKCMLHNPNEVYVRYDIRQKVLFTNVMQIYL